MRGYVIERFTGELVGPFYTREEAEPYLNPGDEIVVVGEHGHVIDYGPQFDESEPDLSESVAHPKSDACPHWDDARPGCWCSRDTYPKSDAVETPERAVNDGAK